MFHDRNDKAIEFKTRLDNLTNEYDAKLAVNNGDIVARIPDCPEVVLAKQEKSGRTDESLARVSTPARRNPFLVILGVLFVLMCPILGGGLFLILPNKWFGCSSGVCAIIFVVYSIIWYIVWDGPLERGSKLP